MLFVEPGGKFPPIRAEIKYTGAGRLKGRWEVVRPGDRLPEPRDLLTEASLPAEERGSQARFTQVGRFNVFLPPGGRFTLPGPAASQMPIGVPGQYLILLRVEAWMIAKTIPICRRRARAQVLCIAAVLRVSHACVAICSRRWRHAQPAQSAQSVQTTAVSGLALLLPAEGRTLPRDSVMDFAWTGSAQAAFHRLEVEDASGGLILSAVLPRGVTKYRAPSWLKEKAGEGNLRWRVVALDQAGARVSETA